MDVGRSVVRLADVYAGRLSGQVGMRFQISGRHDQGWLQEFRVKHGQTSIPHGIWFGMLVLPHHTQTR